MPVELKEKCCCGGEFYVRDTSEYVNSVKFRYQEFLEAHKVCREKTKTISKGD